REVGDVLDRMLAGQDVSEQVHCSYGRVPYFRTDFWRLAGAAATVMAGLAWLALR
ncbi:MAG: hypothetical protein HY303_11700, partial [Candidatus Wallbacteria bacterium]|nr:hypothetical protein [Candidatus Wallbacteria bacterium]